MKIRTKIYSMFFVIIAAIVLMGIFTEYTVRKNIENTILEDTHDRVDEQFIAVSIYINDKISALRELSERVVFQDSIAKSNEEFSKESIDKEYIEKHEWSKSSDVSTMNRIISSRPSRDLIHFIDFYRNNNQVKLFSEIFITNKFGFNIAQSGPTSDYYQADEAWWKRAKSQGIYFGDIEFDQSSKTNSVAICLAIKNSRGDFVGVMKSILDIKSLSGILETLKEGGAYEYVEMALQDREQNDIHFTGKGGSPKLSDASYVYKGKNCFIVEKVGEPDKLVFISNSKGFENFPDIGWHTEIVLLYSEVFAPLTKIRYVIAGFILMISLIVVLIGLLFTRLINRPIEELLNGTRRLAEMDFSAKVANPKKDEIGELARSFNSTVDILKEQNDENLERTKLNSMILKLNRIIGRDNKAAEKYNSVCSYIHQCTGAPIVSLFVAREDRIILSGTFSDFRIDQCDREFDFGEGLIGQCAKEMKNIELNDVPENYLNLNDDEIEGRPTCILIVPLVYNETLYGILELAGFKQFSGIDKKFIEMIVFPLAVAIKNMIYELQQSEMLAESQQLMEELKSSNEAVEKKAKELQQSEEELKQQSEELRVTNEQLMEKNRMLLKDED